ncbi:MAG TPA: ABC transporter permease [Actinomycetota bacterium]
MSATGMQTRTSESPRFKFLERIRAVLGRREVIGNLTGKEMKVKYKSTILGVLWSMLNPLLYLVVFWVVFTVFLPSGIPDFAVFLLSGLLVYSLYSNALQTGTASVVDNAPLVTKVAFPREVLPLSAVGASLVNFAYQFIVLLLFMIVIGYDFWGWNLLLIPVALAVLLLFTTAVVMGTAALNVRYRDTRHLVELSLLAWFWVTPIVYSASVVMGRLDVWAQRIFLANPLAPIVLAFQRGLYGYRLAGSCGDSGVEDALPARLAEIPGCQAVLPDAGLTWYYWRLGLVAAASLLLIAITWRIFFRMSGDFAEEL